MSNVCSVQILQGKLEKRGEGKLAKWKKVRHFCSSVWTSQLSIILRGITDARVQSQNFVILDTVELSLYDDADTKLGAFALANLKV